MKVGDLVKASDKDCQSRNDKGIIMAIVGRKWFKVAWADGIILDEHIDDVKLINETRNMNLFMVEGKKNLTSKKE